MKNNYIKLGTIVTDKVTGINGMITALSIDMSGNINYVFQPSMLNKQTKEPVNTYWVGKERISNYIEAELDIPLEVLSTRVEDKATGFNGVVIDLYRYHNGCTHLVVKSSDLIEETGETVKTHEFDIRRLKGDAIIELSEEELEFSRKIDPSPEFTPNSNCR